ncbi:hypothetical protein B0H17DRAFT_1223216 [Mycena rosella]|uniref:Uncharacterized protein n=1 Tax=Mycena rosella TaxID=1033263 RepID=A0AAD7AWE9_MYCRO|nr:hypothetical protein B0H17DRAFT_1223216 [Mycena rosella]
MKPKPQVSRGYQYFVGCSGWTTKFRQGHQTHSIPDNMDKNLVANALVGLPVTDDPSKDTPPYSGIIHPHTGGKKKHYSHAHIVNGMQVQGQIQNYPCPAIRSIYVPKDLSVRKVLIVYNDIGHNHPMPALTKLLFGLKDTYRGCIKSYGVLRATVAKIDNTQSTKMLLDRKTLSAYAPPLHNKRVKRNILQTSFMPKKLRSTQMTSASTLLNDPGVTSFDGDTMYKGIESKLNEWELSLFAKVVQRGSFFYSPFVILQTVIFLTAASVVRAYITGTSADFFEILFDELQRIKCEVTGKPLPFKRFVPDGNLLVTNVDMDIAQLMGLCRSALKFSDPEYSGIPRDNPPEQLTPEFIKVCWRQGKE